MRPHTLIVLVDDALLALSRAIGVLRRRNLPLEALSLGPGPVAGLTRVTLKLSTPAQEAEQVGKQLRKTDGIRRVAIFGDEEGVTRELALIKVRSSHDHFAELLDVIALFRAAVVHEGDDELIVEVTGSGPFVVSLIRALEPFGVIDVARSGAVAMPRSGGGDAPGSQPLAVAMAAGQGR